MHGCRSNARAQAEATRRRGVLRAARLPGGHSRGRRPRRRDREGLVRPDQGPARRRAASARGRGLRLRARAAVRGVPAHPLAPSQEAARGRDRRGRAPRPVGLLLRRPRSAEGAVLMAELTTCCGTPTESTVNIREAVRDRYAAAAREGAADSLGCGVPTAVADLHEGETVLDLGSGAGADVLISAGRVGPNGKAFGLDMTDEMLELARVSAAEAGTENVEFLKGYIEEIPLPDASVDVVISNCVINLAADKPKVFAEAARVLRPGGRFAVSDVVADTDMDAATRADMAQWTGCIAGALTEDEFRTALARAGLVDVEVRSTHRVHEHAGAAIVRARKPA